MLTFLRCKGIVDMKENKGIEYAIIGMIHASTLANTPIFYIFVEQMSHYSNKCENYDNTIRTITTFH